MGPAFAFGEVTLPPGGSVRVEGGAMATTRGDIEIVTSTQGGFLRGLRRSLGGESFFVNDFTSRTGGTVGVAAVLPGDMARIGLAGQDLLVASGSWWRPTPPSTSTPVGVAPRASSAGPGSSCCGAPAPATSWSPPTARSGTSPLTPGEKITIDTGHIVAFDATVSYNVRKAGGWKTTLLSGEGLRHGLRRPGRLWLQTRSSSGLILWLDSKLPRHTSSD